jgi:phage terminase large subunit-like protein
MPYFDDWVKQYPPRLSQAQRMSFIASLEDPKLRAAALHRWDLWARDNQAPYLFNNDWHTWIIMSGRSFGKALCVDTPILTSNRGWIKNGGIEVGDLVFDEKGMPQTVLQIHHHPASDNKKYYRIIFSDGEGIDCCGDHLWTTWTHQNRKQYFRRDSGTNKHTFTDRYPEDWATYEHRNFKVKPRSTKELINTFYVGRRQDNNHSIPVAQPCYFSSKSYLVDPYILGNWLANGNRSSGVIYCHADDVDFLFSYVANVYPVTKVKRSNRGYGLNIRDLFPQLKQLNVDRNKHIPEDYLYGSVEQRWGLIRGLLDGDGCFEQKSVAVFYNTNKLIIDSVCKILGSLGINYNLNSKIGKIKGKRFKECWSICFISLDTCPFLNPRKAKKWQSWRHNKKSQFHRIRSRVIVKVEEIEPKDMVCITITGASSLYLAGRGCIPTHNSRSGSEFVLSWVRKALAIPNLSSPIYFGVVGPTFSAIKETQIEGPSGIHTLLAPWEKERCLYNKSNQELNFEDKFFIRCYSSEDPSQIRGPSVHGCWVDEIAAMGSRVDEVMDQVGMIVRERPPAEIAPHAQIVVTSTPIFTPYLVDIVKASATDKQIIISTGSSYDNAANLSETFFKSIIKHEGTEKGEIEIHGKLIDAESHSIFKRQWFKLWPKEKALPYLIKVFMCADTAFTTKKEEGRDPSAAVFFGVFEDEDDKDDWQLLVLDFYEVWLEYPELRSRFIDDYQGYYGSEGNKRRVDAIVIEYKGSGMSLGADLVRTGMNIIPFNPKSVDKVERAHAISHLVKDGKVWMIESKKRPGTPLPYFDALLDQWCTFPLSRRDDLTDCLSSMLHLCSKSDILTSERVDYEEEETYYRHPTQNPYDA